MRNWLAKRGVGPVQPQLATAGGVRVKDLEVEAKVRTSGSEVIGGFMMGRRDSPAEFYCRDPGREFVIGLIFFYQFRKLFRR